MTHSDLGSSGVSSSLLRLLRYVTTLTPPRSTPADSAACSTGSTGLAACRE